MSKKELEKLLKNCLIKDTFLLSNKIKQKISANQLDAIQKRITESMHNVEARQQKFPNVSFPENLPIVEKRDEIKKLIQEHQIIIVSGETGSGKTTQLPKICLEMGFGARGYIGHSQPRRIAARSVASRIAEELKVNLGECVGFKIRFSDHTNNMSLIKLMTDGILLAEIQSDRYFLDYEVLIIDEAHERSLNIDFLLGYLKLICKKRPDLKIIITSATIDTKQFSKHFFDAPIVEVSGRTYPVDIRYQPIEDNDVDSPLMQGISDAIIELSAEKKGDTLVFLPGEREIREAAEYLRKHHPPNTEVLPLFSRLSTKDQEKIFKSHNKNRIVLATNVAETSLTVPGIRYVVDAGLARMNRYSVRSRIQRLPIEPISQAAANQRAGRCGRISEGICVRLYSESDYLSRDEFTEPEILRVNLASVILQLAYLKIGSIEDFPFVNRPEFKNINEGKKLLLELGAINENGGITETGKTILKIPVDPRLGKMILQANCESCVSELLVIISFLSIRDPRERPFDQQQKADSSHARFHDDQSDFMSILKLWNYIQNNSAKLSHNKFRKQCQKEFLSFMRIREWKDIFQQIKAQVLEVGFKINSTEASYDAIHRSILSGIFSNVGNIDSDNNYLGTKQVKFQIFPGSMVQKKPKWIMAVEIVQTSRNFARNVAKIDPVWIVELADKLLTRNYFSPYWQKNNGQVSAYEKISLYGLVLIAKRTINYGAIDKSESRNIFIREALIEGNLISNEPFLKHNLQKMNEVSLLEQKSRRLDILVDDTILFEFYDQLIPDDIYSSKSFHQWIKKEKRNNPKILYLEREKLLNKSNALKIESTPDYFPIEKFKIKLTYCFDLGSDKDGVTAKIPLEILPQIDPIWFEWVIPGLLKEKIISLIKSLPKKIRKNFVPVPDFADALVSSMVPYKKCLLDSIILGLNKMTGISVISNQFDLTRMPNYLFFRFEIFDRNKNVIAEGKDLLEIKKQLSDLVKEFDKSSELVDDSIDNICSWDFGSIPEEKFIEAPYAKYHVYPAIVDKTNSVSLIYVSTKQEASEKSRWGILRLIKLSRPNIFSELKKQAENIKRNYLAYSTIGPVSELISETIDFILLNQFISNREMMYSKNEFDERIDDGLKSLHDVATTIFSLQKEILVLMQEISKKIRSLNAISYLDSLHDVNEQLKNLIYRHYIKDFDIDEIKQFPRYLKAVLRRLDKLEVNASADKKSMLLVQKYWHEYKLLLDQNKKSSDLVLMRWMIEEYRISLFAQEIKTRVPVSSQRLDKLVKKCRQGSA